MDAVEDLSTACRAIREIRSSDRCWCANSSEQALEEPLMGKRKIIAFSRPHAVNESDLIPTGNAPWTSRSACHNEAGLQRVVQRRAASTPLGINRGGVISSAKIFQLGR